MKKLLYIILLFPFLSNAQVTGSIQKTVATGTVRGSFGASGIDSLLVLNGVGVNGYVPVWNSTLKKAVWINPSTFGGSTFLQGGNSFGTTAILGTTDNYGLTIKTNNKLAAHIDSTGNASHYSQFASGTVNAFTAERDSGEVRLNLKTFYDRTPHVTADNYPMFQLIRNQKIVNTANYRPMVTGDILGKLAMQAPRQSNGTYNGDGAHSIFGYAGENWSSTQTGSYWGFSAISFGTNTTYFPLYLNSQSLQNSNVTVLGDGVAANVLRVRATAAGADLLNVASSGNLTVGGSIGLTGSRVSKGWFTDLEVTNPITGSITGNAGTVTNGVYTTGNQTIGGLKTFSSTLGISGGNALQVESGVTGNSVLLQAPVGLGGSVSVVLPSVAGTLATLASPAFTGTPSAPAFNLTGTLSIVKNSAIDISPASNTDYAQVYLHNLSGNATIGLEASSSSIFTGSTAYAMVLGTAVSKPVEIFTNGTKAATFASGGDFTIAGANATKASGTAWINPSDRNLKKNVQPYTKGLKELMQITPKVWNFNAASGFDQTKKHVSPIAQELKTVMPEMVGTYTGKLNGKDAELLNIDGSDYDMLLINAVKEQQVIIEKQDKRILELEKRLLKLETK